MARDKFELQYAVVFGNRCSEFPIDMLRYDRCFPANEHDANKAERLAVSRQDPRFRAVVVAHHLGSPAKWTPARWASFGWPIIPRGNSYQEARELADYIEQNDGPPPWAVQGPIPNRKNRV